MQEERASRDDGLIQRILCCAPMPKFYRMDVVKDARSIEMKFSMSVFLYVIHRFHNKVTNLLYEKATEAFRKYYSEYKGISEKMNIIHMFVV